MDDSIFRAPPPYSGTNIPREMAPIYMTSEGMLMPSHMQPPPMYGPRGSTIPPKFLGKQHHKKEFYCETCDRDFQFQIDLDAHIGEHQKCGIDGCPFFGNPGLVAKHIEQQHTSGLYEKLKNLNTPEEIAKWREERRKRYPTQANVALRQQIRAEKVKRGERLGDNKSRFGRQNDRNRCRENEKPANETHQRKRRRVRKPRYEERAKAEAEEKPVEDECQIKAFKGTATIPDYPRPVKKKIKVVNALSSLAGLYGSDSEGEDSDQESEHESQRNDSISSALDLKSTSINISSDEDDHNENPPQLLDIFLKPDTQFESNSPPKEGTVTVSIQNEEQQSVSISHISNEDSLNEPASSSQKEKSESDEPPDQPKSESDADDQQEDVPFEKVVESFDQDENEVETNNTKANGGEEAKSRKRTRQPKKHDGESATTNKTKQKKRMTSGLDYSRLRCRRQNTMLEKLLQKDIIHERNVLLQCVRYVVQKNFFGIGQPT